MCGTCSLCGNRFTDQSFITYEVIKTKEGSQVEPCHFECEDKDD